MARLNQGSQARADSQNLVLERGIVFILLEILGEAPAGVSALSRFLFDRVDVELAKSGEKPNDLTLLALQAAER